MESYYGTSSHSTCLGTLFHSLLSSLSHCGLIMAKKSGIFVYELISTLKKKKRNKKCRQGVNCRIFPPKKSPPHPDFSPYSLVFLPCLSRMSQILLSVFVFNSSRYGIIYHGTHNNCMEVTFQTDMRRYRILHILDFSSARRCMSVIVQNEKG